MNLAALVAVAVVMTAFTFLPLFMELYRDPRP